ncbi:hypothetical protein [Varunaivibrio sulfuroxidans]|uniref:Uncharacterized protein n=1 Tax=Varunaivibrio sulfuroxidans TaxID=1773489 RepID=A0A4R3JFV0_9PROT|nr:hypothetical protein [Varunaivibrio sulfuroxidans]TCS64727.1 hypothetical protein EDD55_10153 [Varunaivibrio sulfuroxidans]WES29968.1 hypothetical protein P3M64_10000 [Varunaivibrio sulfuroxidans]
MNQLTYANVPTPTPGDDWLRLRDAERRARVNAALEAMPASTRKAVNVVECKDDGQVILRLLEPLSPDKRGTLLLDVEDHLKTSLDNALVVWLEPLGDRSSLRKLRGIEVKS